MVIALAVLSPVFAADGPMSQIGANVPTCHPISDSVEVLAFVGLLGATPVYIEEHSACTGPIAPVRPLVPDDLQGRDALQYVVDTVSARGGSQYSITDRASGFLIAETGENRVVDVTVDLDPQRFPTVGQARASLFGQIAIQAKVWMPPGGVPSDIVLWKEPTTVALQDSPFLEALRALYAPREPASTGFILRVDDAELDPLGRKQARLSLLRDRPMPAEFLVPLPVATPENAFSGPPVPDGE